jgi:hypothetical protein
MTYVEKKLANYWAKVRAYDEIKNLPCRTVAQLDEFDRALTAKNRARNDYEVAVRFAKHMDGVTV